PKDLLDRRVEITGPVDRKMIINALNSGANVYMADFEDANSPTWANNVEGQLNLKDRWAGRLAFTDAATGKKYAIGKNPAVLIVRPRGWHLPEQHLTVDGEPIAGALFDFGLYYFHNAEALRAQGTGPYFYLPKLESHIEARLWNDVFLHAYALLLIKTCHRRGAFAMGGMAAQIPVKNDPAANEAAFVKVRADKEREANDGHDGTWVAHPDLVPIAKQVFDRLMRKPNQ